MLRKINRLKRQEVTGVWTKLHIEKLHGLQALQSIIRMIKSRRLRLIGEVIHTGLWGENLKQKVFWTN